MPYDRDQIANLEADLAALVSPTSDDVLAVSDDYDAAIVAAVAAKMALGGVAGGPQTVYVQTEDPGAVGPGIIWVDINSDPVAIMVRNYNNDTWVSITPALTAVLAVGSDAEGQSLNNIGGVFTDGQGTTWGLDTSGIDTDGGSIDTGSGDLTCGGVLASDDILQHNGSSIGFYGAAAVAQQTGVAVNIAAVHAALVNLGLITA